MKSTHLEWKEGPHGKAGIVCQDCHMPPAPGRSALMGSELPDVRQHLFHGAHDPGKLAGVDRGPHPSRDARSRTGRHDQAHGGVRQRQGGPQGPVGLGRGARALAPREATDAKGKVYHLPVDTKGFEGEEFTIASDALAYQDIGEIKGIADFPGLRRDGEVPVGRSDLPPALPRPEGAHDDHASGTRRASAPTTAWRRFGARSETYTWKLPANLPAGPVMVTADVFYSRLVSRSPSS